jgi:hypothetical protein
MNNTNYPIIQKDSNKLIRKLVSHECAEIYLGEFLWAAFRKIPGISDAYTITLTNTLTGDVPYYQSLGTVEELEEFVVSYTINRTKWDKVK